MQKTPEQAFSFPANQFTVLKLHSIQVQNIHIFLHNGARKHTFVADTDVTQRAH